MLAVIQNIINAGYYKPYFLGTLVKLGSIDFNVCNGSESLSAI